MHWCTVHPCADLSDSDRDVTIFDRYGPRKQQFPFFSLRPNKGLRTCVELQLRRTGKVAA